MPVFCRRNITKQEYLKYIIYIVFYNWGCNSYEIDVNN